MSFQDSFNGTNGTALTSHTPDSGSGYSAGANLVLNGSGRCKATNADAQATTTDTFSGSWYVQANFVFATGTALCYVQGAKTDDNNQYSAAVFFNGTSWQLVVHRYVAGTPTAVIGPSDITYPDLGGGDFEMDVRLEGVVSGSVTDLTLKYGPAGGTLSALGTYHDTAGLTGTHAGIRIGNAASGEMLIDDFKAGTLAASTTIPADNANLLTGFSLNLWERTGSGASARVICNKPGMFDITFTGTSLTLNFDWSVLVGISAVLSQYPLLRYSVDDGPWTVFHSTASSAVLATGLSAGTHTVRGHIQIDAYTDRWTSATGAMRISGVTVDSGETVNAQSYTDKIILCHGTSIGEGASNVAASTSTTYIDSSNVLFSWPTLLAAARGGRPHNISYGGEGWLAGFAPSNTPKFASEYDHYDGTTSVLSGGKWPEIPDEWFVEMGANDGLNTISALQTEIQAWGAAARATVNTTTPIFLIIPFGQFTNPKTAINNAVTALADPHLYVLDCGTPGSIGVTNVSFGTANVNSFDDRHPNQQFSAVLAGMVNRLATAALGGGSGGIRVQRHFTGGLA